MTFVQFPLVPGDSEKWFVWKGSASHPLIVIDPDHKGEVSSAYQLLGNWTFGGQTRSLQDMLAPNARPAVDAKPWQHGFDALATLDRDNDGTLKGAELAPLGLWFDQNKNGISEKGEVKTLEEARVVSLFYRDARYDEALDGYHLKVGFERMVDGMVEKGSSFDWFSSGDTSKERLITSELGKLRAKQVDGDKDVPNKATQAFIPDAKIDHTAMLNGSWRWMSDQNQNPGEPAIGGILKLLVFENGDVRGVAFSESQYAQPYPLNSIAMFNSVEGTLSDSKQVSFKVQSSQWKLESRATLSVDGKTLTGKTTATDRTAGRSLSYDWVASKAN